jgi:hypothetical protein
MHRQRRFQLSTIENSASPLLPCVPWACPAEVHACMNNTDTCRSIQENVRVRVSQSVSQSINQSVNQSFNQLKSVSQFFHWLYVRYGTCCSVPTTRYIYGTTLGRRVTVSGSYLGHTRAGGIFLPDASN